jgi:glycerol-3-phosphate acyltransferase PlsX
MSRRVRIALDAMGGDHAPDEIVGGALAALKGGSVEILLVGDPARLEPLLTGHDRSGLRVIPASQVIEMDEAPALALRQKKDASITVAMRLLKEGQADAVVAAGSTGAAMAAALMILGRIPGIERPAIAVPLPTAHGPTVLLDVGANVDSKPSYLHQFALMGNVYARTIFKREHPRVGLLNIGSEEGKGTGQRSLCLAERQPPIEFHRQCGRP